MPRSKPPGPVRTPGGFAVVDDEVRKLAENSARQTREIEEMIRKVQEETSRTIALLEESRSRASQNQDYAGETRAVLEEIRSVVQTIGILISRPSEAIRHKV